MYSLETLAVTLASVAACVALILAALYIVVPLAYRAQRRRRHAAE